MLSTSPSASAASSKPPLCAAASSVPRAPNAHQHAHAGLDRQTGVTARLSVASGKRQSPLPIPTAGLTLLPACRGFQTAPAGDAAGCLRLLPLARRPQGTAVASSLPPLPPPRSARSRKKSLFRTFLGLTRSAAPGSGRCPTLPRSFSYPRTVPFSRPASPDLTRNHPNTANGPATGLQRAAEIRVYHGRDGTPHDDAATSRNPDGRNPDGVV